MKQLILILAGCCGLWAASPLWAQVAPGTAPAPTPEEIARKAAEEEAIRRAGEAAGKKEVDPAILAAQEAMAKAAEAEALKRQEIAIIVGQFLAQAAQMERNDREAAAKQYEQAIALTAKVSQGVEKEREQAIAGLVRVRLQQALDSQRRADFAEAADIVGRAVVFAPDHPELVRFNRQNEQAQALFIARNPGKQTQLRINEVKEQKGNVKALLQDGKFLYELRDLAEAEAKFREVVRLDPGNDIAFAYLRRIQSTRADDAAKRKESAFGDRLADVDRAWLPPNKASLLPTPNPLVHNPVAHTSKGRSLILQKLESIKIPEINALEGFSMTEVIDLIDKLTKKNDPASEGLNFIINPNITNTLTRGGGAAPQPPPGGQPPVVPPMIDPNTGLPIPQAPGPQAPATPGSIDPGTVKIKGLTTPLRNLTLAQLLDAVTKSFDTPVKFTIEDYAVVFTHKAPENQDIFTRTFRINPNTFQQGLDSVSGGAGAAGGGGPGGAGPGGGGAGPGGNRFGSAEAPKAFYGANVGWPVGVPGIPNAPQASFNNKDILNAVGGGGNPGGGGNNPGGGGGAGAPPQIPLANISGVTQVRDNSQVVGQVRAFFQAAGVNLQGQNATQIFFNDRTGILMVRASLADLDIIEEAIEVLNTAPPQVQIEAKFAEISLDKDKSLGFDWFLGNSRSLGGAILQQAGTAPSYIGQPTPNNPSGFFPYPGTLNIDQFNPGTGNIAPRETDGRLTSGFRGLNSPIGTITGILTDPQFRMVIHAIESETGTDVLSAPRVTTLSGRQAQLSVIDQQSVVTGVNVGAGANQGGGGFPGGGGGFPGGGFPGGGFPAIGGNTPVTLQPQVSTLPFGPTLDVIPYVSADGYSIEMSIVPRVTEFLGYDKIDDFKAVAQTGNNDTRIDSTTPLPKYRTRQIVTSCIVWDAQTVMLGGMISENIFTTKDKVPFLGDLPFVGRAFRSESRNNKKKNMIVFVTPTIIDPAGNRVHNDEHLPFARTAIPSQPPLLGP